MKKLIIFDLDGTLTPSKSEMDSEMAGLLCGLLQKKKAAVVSGGSFSQFEKQLLKNFSCPENFLKELFLFPNNAARFYRFESNAGWQSVYQEELTAEETIKIREAFFKAFEDIGFVPEKAPFGEIIEDRGSQITFSALGQNAPLELKQKWDPDQKKRLKIKKALEKYLLEFQISIGGATSIDVTKKGLTRPTPLSRWKNILMFQKKKCFLLETRFLKAGTMSRSKKSGLNPSRFPTRKKRKSLLKN